jgi:hypothetical protein
MAQEVSIMFSIKSGITVERIRPIMAAIRTIGVPVEGSERAGGSPWPFITISRQAGAGGWTLAQGLVERLNCLETADTPWTCWDRELVEKVATEHHVSGTLIESLEGTAHSWWEDFFASLSSSGPEQPGEIRLYRWVIATIIDLARAGRTVIVGRGGVFITRNLPGGVHIRLVAPLAYRIDHMSQYLGVSKAAAAAEIARIDRRRDAFYHRYWPGETLRAENFTMMLNTAAMTEEQMVSAIVPRVHVPLRAAVAGD